MSDTWEKTLHGGIQVRLVAPHIGFAVRIKREEPMRDGCARCEVCGRVFAAVKSGKPWAHKCADEPGWKVLQRRPVDEEKGSQTKCFPTRQLAYAAGARALDLVTDMGRVVREEKAA